MWPFRTTNTTNKSVIKAIGKNELPQHEYDKVIAIAEKIRTNFNDDSYDIHGKLYTNDFEFDIHRINFTCRGVLADVSRHYKKRDTDSFYTLFTLRNSDFHFRIHTKLEAYGMKPTFYFKIREEAFHLKHSEAEMVLESFIARIRKNMHCNPNTTLSKFLDENIL